jgi:hypothetical protein
MSMLGVARRSPWRWLLAVAAVVTAVAHVPVIAPHLEEAPYMGALFVVLTVACLFLAAAALVRDTTLIYGLALLTCGLGVVGYLATRSVAFPQLADDVGNWFEPLGVVSVLAELVVITAAILGLRSPHRAGTTAAHA